MLARSGGYSIVEVRCGESASRWMVCGDADENCGGHGVVDVGESTSAGDLVRSAVTS